MSNELFDVIADPGEKTDIASTHPDVVASMAAALDAMEKREPLTLGERKPDREAPGAPPAIQPDTRPAVATPFAESGPISYPPGNRPATEQ